MRRLPTIIGAGLVAAATASAIAVTSGSAQAPGERTLTFVEREVTASDVFADVPPLATKKRPIQPRRQVPVREHAAGRDRRDQGGQVPRPVQLRSR